MQTPVLQIQPLAADITTRKLFRNDRVNKVGGGVAIYSKAGYTQGGFRPWIIIAADPVVAH